MKTSTGIADHYKIEYPLFALVQILITWRNNTVHYRAHNTIPKIAKDAIERDTELIFSNYCGMDASELVEKAEAGADFTFKEAASLIHAAHDFVAKLDEHFMTNIDFHQLACKTTASALEKRNAEVAKSEEYSGTKGSKFRTKYYSKAPRDRRQMVQTFLKNSLGFDYIPDAILLECCNIPK